jgi:hypothetical protein
MCDMRQFPTGIYIKSKDKIVPIDKPRYCRAWGSPDEQSTCDIGVHYSKINEPGMYFVSATGAGYKYFDGKNWFSVYGENVEYKPLFDESFDESKEYIPCCCSI